MATVVVLLLLLLRCCGPVYCQVSQIEVYGQDCEIQGPDGNTIYQACRADPQLLTSQTPHTIAVTPEDLTCGATTKQKVLTQGVTKVIECDPDDPEKQYPPENMVDGGNRDTYWVSRPWTTFPTPFEGNITFSFNKTYELLDDLVILFESVRPRSMTIRFSKDYGVTWQNRQYYRKVNRECKELIDAGQAVANVPYDRPASVVCTEAYSQVLPFIGGEVRLDLTKDRYLPYLGPNQDNYQELIEHMPAISPFMTFTDIQISLLEPSTDDNKDNNNPDIQKRYFYAIQDVRINGGCSCNFHAQECPIVNDQTMCECRHNTDGKDCEYCLPLYNERPWQAGSVIPYPRGTANECKICNCNEHAISCTYDATLNTGVCDFCLHNTIGIHCDTCAVGYARNLTVPISDINVCYACDCEMLGVANNDTTCRTSDGQCNCAALVTGRRCDQCVNQFYGLILDDRPGTCKNCACMTDGTVFSSNNCDPFDGQCPCQPNIGQRDCSACKDEYWYFPTGQPGRDCVACNCAAGASITLVCNKTDGQCQCQPNAVGMQCTELAPGYYAPAVDATSVQPMTGGSTCTLSAAMYSDQYPFSGLVFTYCNHGQMTNMELLDGGSVVQPEMQWPYRLVIRYSLNGTDPWLSGQVRVTVLGSSAGMTCPVGPGTMYTYDAANLTAGYGEAWISAETVTIDKQCTYSTSFTANSPGNASQPIMIDSVVLLPDPDATVAYTSADAAGQIALSGCYEGILSLSSAAVTLLQPTCRALAYSVGTQMAKGGVACDCDATGSVMFSTCDSHGGQCVCIDGVGGRRCDRCDPGYYNFTASGCRACDCSPLGSSLPVCDYDTGQCPCLPNVGISGEGNMLGLTDDLRCQSCKIDHFGFYTGLGCSLCACNTAGSYLTQCDDFGVCTCKPTITGEKCSVCEPGYYSFSENGCTLCDCNPAGSVSINCEAGLGTCTCKSNVMGAKCDTCNSDSFNLAASNPEGCQKCFCHGHGTVCVSAAGYGELILQEESTTLWTVADPVTPGDNSYRAAPTQFQGMLLGAYNTELTMDAAIVGSDPANLAGETVILEGNGQTAYYNASDVTITNSYSRLAVPIHHQYWYYNQTTQPNSFQFYAILADVTNIYLPRYRGNREVLIRDVSMTTSVIGGSPSVTNMEACECTPDRHTDGDSCEICATGFMRNPLDGTPYHMCTACNCGFRGQTTPPMCDERSGVCLNCRDGTMGDHCEACAPFVNSGSCETCLDLYFGLSQEGCKPCNCDEVGSISPITCDKETGACSCKQYVTGDKCDECQDNYFNLQPSGCEVCDSCYQLIMAEVNDLREMRDNLTSFVTLLIAGDETGVLGLFHDRLVAVRSAMDNLVIFLTQSNAVEGSVDSEIQRLNSTVQHLQYQVDVNAVGLMAQSNNSLYLSDALTEQSLTKINETIATATTANNLLQGPIAAFTAELQALATALGAYETRLGGVTDTAVGDVLTVANTVSEIEQKSQQSVETSLVSLQSVTNSATVHAGTTAAVTSLENFMASVVTLSNDVTSQSSQTKGDTSLTLTEVNALRLEVLSLLPITTDYAAMQNQAGSLQEEANGLRLEAEAATVGDGSTVARVNAAQQQTASLLSRLQTLNTTSATQYGRTDTAYSKALEAQAMEVQAFEDANSMKAIVTDFTTTADAIELQANASLADVTEVQTLSQEAINSAGALRSQLQPTYIIAQNARTTAQGALTTATAHKQALAPLKAQAEGLIALTGTSLNDIGSKASGVSATNISTIQPALAQAKTNQVQIDDLDTKVNSALGNATEVNAKISSTSSRLTAIMNSLTTVDGISNTDLSGLLALVEAAREDFDARKLSEAVVFLSGEVQAQADWIAAAKARKDIINLKITRMNNIKNALQP